MKTLNSIIAVGGFIIGGLQLVSDAISFIKGRR